MGVSPVTSPEEILRGFFIVGTSSLLCQAFEIPWVARIDAMESLVSGDGRHIDA